MSTTLHTFYFGQRRGFLIPVEHLSQGGISPEFAAALGAERGLEAPWIERFDAALSAAFARADDLFQRSPATWFPPRLLNVCVATDAESVHPYQRPLSGSAWLFFASDFAPETSSLELATYLFLHAERLNVTGDVPTTVASNLSYFLTRTPEELEDFREGCRRSTRPDAAAYRALADALPWICALHHTALRPPQLALAAAGELAGTGLVVPKDDQPRVTALTSAFEATIQEVIQGHYARYVPASSPGEELIAWLVADAPRVVLVNGAGEMLWDPDAPEDVDRLRPVVSQIAAAPAQSLREDLAVVDARTRAFFRGVRDADTLPLPTEEIDQADGSYLHAEKRLMAFDLTRQPSWVPLGEVTPLYQRLLLAARTIHEWGHLCEENGLVAVPERRRRDYEVAQATLANALGGALARAPAPLRDYTLRELDSLGRADGSPGEGLAGFALARMPDFLANVVARRFLLPEELEAYVRVNVRSHREERLGPYRLLANYLVEYQYLSLSPIADPFRYFLDVTGAGRLFVGNGLLSEAELRELFGLVRLMCDCVEVDEERFVSG